MGIDHEVDSVDGRECGLVSSQRMIGIYRLVLEAVAHVPGIMSFYFYPALRTE